MIDNYRYASNYPDRPGRARPTPRPGGAAGRRHADHPEARRRLSQRQHPTGLRRRAAALGRLARGRPGDDASLAVYLGELFEAGRAPATAALAVAAVRFRAKLAGQPAPAGEATARVLGGYRRTAADRGRGQAAPLRADGLAGLVLLLVVIIVRLSSVELPKPIVVRVDDVGRAEALAYDTVEAQADPLDPTTKYFLNRFINDYYSRRGATVEQAWPRALRFLTTSLANEAFRLEGYNVAMLAAGAARDELQVERVTLRIQASPEPPHAAGVKSKRGNLW